jgi:hypothetical protein
MNKVFANCSEEDEINPLTAVEIVAGQRADASLKHLFKRNAVIDQGLVIKLIENMTCVCKDGWLVIPKPPWLAMSGFVSVSSTPQTTDIFVCRRHVDNVGPTRWQHSVMSANF